MCCFASVSCKPQLDNNASTDYDEKTNLYDFEISQSEINTTGTPVVGDVILWAQNEQC